MGFRYKVLLRAEFQLICQKQLISADGVVYVTQGFEKASFKLAF
jgi:hypothetical protein